MFALIFLEGGPRPG